MLNTRQVPTRCADNGMWAVANNSTRVYSNWPSFVARPDATIAQRLKRNQAGMLVHDFPDGLSERGWRHNHLPMKLAEGEPLHFGQPSDHPRQRDGSSKPYGVPGRRNPLLHPAGEFSFSRALSRADAG